MLTIAKTEAVPLRISPFSNTSRVVTWLTPDYGKIATVIKGACRPRQDSGGQYDLGYRCELLFYAQNRNGLYIFKACAALDNRRRCRGDWRRTAAISYICHLIALATPDEAHFPDCYQLVNETLTLLNEQPAPHDTLLLWFELELLDQLGLAPQLHHCTACAERIAPEASVRFASVAGGILCDACAATRETAAIRLDATTLALLRRWQRAARFAPLQTEPLTDAPRKTLCRSLGHFMSYHLDLAPACRQVAYQMLALHVPAQPADT